MAQISHRKSGLWINIICYTELSVFDGECLCLCLCLCLCYNDKTWKYCIRTEAEGDILGDERGSSKGMNKIAQWGDTWFVLVTEWWWVVNWKQWESWDKRNALEKLEIHKKFQFETLRGRRILGDVGLDQMLQTVWWTGHKGLQLQLPSAQWNTDSSFAM